MSGGSGGCGSLRGMMAYPSPLDDLPLGRVFIIVGGHHHYPFPLVKGG